MELIIIEPQNFKKTPVFNSIDEQELYLNDNMKDCFSVILTLLKDYDILRKIFSPEEAKKEVNISHNLEELLEELKESPTALTQVAKNVKEHSEERLGVRPKRKRVYYYFCKENG